MRSVFNLIQQLGPAGIVVQAIVASMVGIGLLVAFILVRRKVRGRRFRQREQRALAIRGKWEAIVNVKIPPETWRFHPLDREIIQSILLDALEVAAPDQAEPLLRCLRRSGLLDALIYEARQLRGLRRSQALLALGRTRAPEAIPALVEVLDEPDDEVRLDAVRALGRIGLPKAAVGLLEQISVADLSLPAAPLQNALLNCCRAEPRVLVPFLRRADDTARPLLARVLGEIATAEMGDDLLLLTVDPLPEVRASAARALGRAKSKTALSALANLARDPEWFVRLRATVALGELNDPLAIPLLIATLCDANRYVRLRSAAALAGYEQYLGEILELVQRTGDRYALQALVSELERSGGVLKLINALVDPEQQAFSRAALLGALRAGTQRLLLDAMAHHANWRVRLSVARLLAHSGENNLAPEIERLAASSGSLRQQRVMRWVVHKLRAGAATSTRTEKIPA
jgi:HEAT repeat protein